MRFLKALFFVSSLAIVFGWGVLVGRNEVFPYLLIKSVQNYFNISIRADAEEGKRLFVDLCARCHAMDGSGGEGPSLHSPNLSRATSDDVLRAIIRDGTGVMRPVRQTTVTEQNDLIAYVRTLSRDVPLTGSTGNTERGKAVYDDLGCVTCHIIDGVGEGIGPELTDIGAIRGADYLRQALTNPSAALPRGVSDVSEGLTEFLPVRVVTGDGREIRGTRVNEDTFTIQVRDSDNTLHSFRKSDLRLFEKEPRTSRMPSLEGKISASQLDDLVAYLSSLRGRR